MVLEKASSLQNTADALQEEYFGGLPHFPEEFIPCNAGKLNHLFLNSSHQTQRVLNCNTNQVFNRAYTMRNVLKYVSNKNIRNGCRMREVHL